MAKIVKGKVTFETEPKFGYVKGYTKWAKILAPDDYDKYSVNLYGEEIEGMETELKELLDTAGKELEALDKQFTVADIFRVDDSGKKFLNFKLNATDFEGKPQNIKIYDVTGKEVTKTWNALIGNGSLVKIKYRVAPYYMAASRVLGLTFRFYAVQIINLQEYKATSGFGDETASAAFDKPFDEEF
ncbi:MAG: hypothetical protein IE909_08680 [Campylobacterales bacterium]|nr:hypothetical protein [Campylobacterales bacterium]